MGVQSVRQSPRRKALKQAAEAKLSPGKVGSSACPRAKVTVVMFTVNVPPASPAALAKPSRQSPTMSKPTTPPKSRGKPEAARSIRGIRKRMKAEKIRISGVEYKATDALATLFVFMKERHDMFLRRLAGQQAPWTEDQVLSKLSLCNTYRLYDRNTQYLIREIVNPFIDDRPEPTDENARRLLVRDLFLRIIVFRTWNKIETWEALADSVEGDLDSQNVDYEAMIETLEEAHEKATLYSPAYQNNNVHFLDGYKFTKDVKMFKRHVWLIKKMMEEDVPDMVGKAQTFKEIYDVLRTYPGMGPFLGYQLALDLNMIPYLQYEVDFAEPGPGAQKGLVRVFGKPVGRHAHALIRTMVKRQGTYWSRLRLDPPCLVDDDGHPVGEAGVTVVEVEHALCELEKVMTYQGGKRVKRTDYQPTGRQVTATHPRIFG